MSTPVFDLHAHPSMKTYLFKKKIHKSHKPGGAFNPFSMRVDLPSLRAGGVNGLLSAIYLPEKGLLEDCFPLKMMYTFAPRRLKRLLSGNPFDETVMLIEHFEKVVSSAPAVSGVKLEIAKSRAELDKVIANGDIALVHSIEGGHSLNSDPGNVQRLFDRGVASITLAHFYENGVAPPVDAVPSHMKKMGCFRKPKNLSLGLTNTGRQVVDEMMRLGMLIDLTHCTPKAREDVFTQVGTSKPVVMTHCGSFPLRPDPMNPTDAEAKKIAAGGGLIGVIFMTHWLTADHKPWDILRYVVVTIRRLVGVVGEDAVGFGSDFDGLTDPPDDLVDPSGIPLLARELEAAGLSTGTVEKVLGGNAMRVLKAGWGR